MLARALPLLTRADPPPLPSLVFAVDFLQVFPRPFVLLIGNRYQISRSIYIALLATLLHPPPLFFLFVCFYLQRMKYSVSISLIYRYSVLLEAVCHSMSDRRNHLFQNL